MSALPGQFLGTVIHRRSTPGWTVTDLRHSRPNQFPAHAHRWTCLTVLLAGEYAERIEGAWHHRQVNTLILRPAQAPHGDRVGAAGAWFLNVEVSPDLAPARADAPGPLGEWRVSRHPDGIALGWRLLGELRRGDAADAAVIDGYVTALVAGLVHERSAARQPPGWLRRAIEMLEPGCHETPSLDALARECGVHPAHLTRVFRRHLGQTVGSYARALRLRAAMERLGRGVNASRAGHEAGFHDQSHLTRTMRAVTGLTPGQYRRQAAA